MSLPKHFRLTFSHGSPWINAYLLKYSKKLAFKDALSVSTKLQKSIEKINKAIEKDGLPSNLHLAYVHPKVQTGVFLKPTSAPIKGGSFIGIYTGHYELVDSEIMTGTSYAYDVAQDLTLKKDELKHFARYEAEKRADKDYSIQTNALEMGNFTRYINHTSLAPNIEAVVSKLSDGRLEIILFALHTIKPGEQLLSCYGGQYWKALGVIPNDMKPDTYLLTKGLKAKLSNPIKSLPEKQKTLLMPLRNAVLDIPENVENRPLVKALTKKAPRMNKKEQKEISDFEDFVLERGIPRKWQITPLNGNLKISLKAGEKPIRKNKLIGSLSGSLSLKSSSCSFLIDENKKPKLFLDCKKESNFLSRAPRDSKKSNLALKIGFDKELDSLVILVFATKTIHPKDFLVFSEM